MCKLTEVKEEGQAWVSSKRGKTLLRAVRPQSRTHNYEQTPTAPLCPDSPLPSESPLSVGCQSKAKGKTETARHQKSECTHNHRKEEPTSPTHCPARPVHAHLDLLFQVFSSSHEVLNLPRDNVCRHEEGSSQAPPHP